MSSNLTLLSLTISCFSLCLPQPLWSKVHLCSSGRRCLAQYTYPHLHSTPKSPTFLLQSKHLFLSACSIFLAALSSYYVTSTFFYYLAIVSTHLSYSGTTLISSFFFSSSFLTKKYFTCGRKNRVHRRPQLRRKSSIRYTWSDLRCLWGF